MQQRRMFKTRRGQLELTPKKPGVRVQIKGDIVLSGLEVGEIIEELRRMSTLVMSDESTEDDDATTT